MARAQRHRGRSASDDRGGIFGVVAELKLHGDAIESDLLRFYAIDLPADLGTPRLTWRRLRLLLRYLPREASYTQAVLGERAAWSVTEHLLAAIVDVIQAGNYITTRAHFKGKPAVPKPVRRPGEKPDSDRFGGRALPVSAMRAVLDHWDDAHLSEASERTVI